MAARIGNVGRLQQFTGIVSRSRWNITRLEITKLSTLNQPLVGQELLRLRHLELDLLGILQETVLLKLKPATNQIYSFQAR